jgi:uncharacterized membrane protein (UPF0182 family)
MKYILILFLTIVLLHIVATPASVQYFTDVLAFNSESYTSFYIQFIVIMIAVIALVAVDE